MLTLHILSRVATPHNNCLVKALRAIPGWRVVTWYAVRSDKMYGWTDELGVHPDTRYLDNWPSAWSLIVTVLSSRRQRVLFIGYTETSFRLLMLICWLVRRPFLYWTDHPQETAETGVRRWLRAVSYWILRTGAERVLVVGRHTIDWFKARGFPSEGLENFPIFIDLPARDRYPAETCCAIREKYGVHGDFFFFVSGSRLIREKGFDVLIDGVAQLPAAYRLKMRVLIVGKGPERTALEQQASSLGLSELVRFEDWLSAPDFEAVVAASDAFVHPSRFDAFGGGTLVAMAVGVPVIGSDGAGAVVERVEEGLNGYIFPKDSHEALAHCLICFMSADAAQRRALKQAARLTAENWAPETGARRLHQLASGG